jgi:hypothetical protein
MSNDYIFDLINEQKELREERKILHKKLEKTPILSNNHNPLNNGKTPDHIMLEKRLKEIEARLIEIREFLRIRNLLK